MRDFTAKTSENREAQTALHGYKASRLLLQKLANFNNWTVASKLSLYAFSLPVLPQEKKRTGRWVGEKINHL